MQNQKKKRGLATLSPEKRKEIARLGGISAHLLKVAHEFTPKEASRAGKLGGVARQKQRREVKEIA